MNPQWNTPPNGDFAAYVERLSAQAALPRREHVDGEHGLDVGMTPTSEPHDAASTATEAARRRMQSNGESQPAAIGRDAKSQLVKVAVIAWVAVLALALAFGVPFIFVLGLFGVGLWLGRRLRCWALPAGMASWKQWLEQEARQQQLRKQQQLQQRQQQPGRSSK